MVIDTKIKYSRLGSRKEGWRDATAHEFRLNLEIESINVNYMNCSNKNKPKRKSNFTHNLISLTDLVNPNIYNPKMSTL